MVIQLFIVVKSKSIPYPNPAKQRPYWKGATLPSHSGDERLGPFRTSFSQSEWQRLDKKGVKISGHAIVFHALSADSEKDQGVQGQFQASHAEKQLIAYFLDRHVFLPEEEIPYPHFGDKIARLETEIAEMASRYPSISQLNQLREEKGNLERDLFSKDDRLLGEDYDEGLVQQLRMDIANLNEEGASLEELSGVKEFRAPELRIECEGGEKTYECLNRISQMAPKDTLSWAIILISAPNYEVCKDCLLFKDRVNSFFGLSIELHECSAT